MVNVEMKTGKVDFIEVALDELPLSKALEMFGRDYIETWYKFCDCDLGDVAPVFESPDGNLRYFEYRSRGIAIQFVDKPIGFKSAKECEKFPECRPTRKTVKRKRS